MLLSRCLFAICTSSLVNVYSNILPTFKNWVACVPVTIFWESFILDTSSLSNMCFASIFSPSVTYPFILLRVILKEQILIFMKFNLSIFSFTDYDFNIVSQKLVPNSWPERFFSRSFIVLGFIFKYNIHFELVLVWCEVLEVWIQVPFFWCGYPVVPGLVEGYCISYLLAM